MVAAAALASINLLVISQYMLQFERDGAGITFSDAITRLSRRLPEYGSRTIYVTDWGMQNSLAMQLRGDIRLVIAENSFRYDTTPESEFGMQNQMLSDREALLLGHVEAQEMFLGVRGRIERAARQRGLRKEIIEIVEDSHRRPVFEVYRLIPYERP
jgi:hypothetical protein